jgi:hypothetical protein
LLESYCALERLLALVRAGHPPDLAWAQAVGDLRSQSGAVADLWGTSVWSKGLEPKGGPAAREAISRAGTAVRKAIQCALLEGRPAGERIEAAGTALRAEIEAAVERELGLLATRGLKPLFLCVAPALLGLLGAAMAMVWLSSGGGGLGGF